VVVEYSKKQRCFHISTIPEMLLANRRTVFTSSTADFLPVGIFETDEEAENFISDFRNRKAVRF